MRVIVLTDYGYVCGGAAQVAISSLNGLAEAGLDVIFVSSVGPIDPCIDRNRIHVVNFGLHDLLENPSRSEAFVRGIWDSRCADKLREVLGCCDPADTIIHLHTWVKSLSSSVVHAATSMGFKVVCTLHDYFTICPNGGLFNFPQQKPCLLKPMSIGCIASNCDSRNYPQKLWRVGRQLIQETFGGIPIKLRYFITVSAYSEALLRPHLPPHAEFYRIRNPIAVTKGEPSVVRSNQAFTFIGRIAPEKGPTVFAEAARLANVRAVFVGSGPMEESIASSPFVELQGWRDRPGVIQGIQSSRAVVFPSLLHETQGMSVQEAAALGVPSIVSDSCAAKEEIIDGENGLLFRAGDAVDLSTKLRLLDSDPELAARLGARAYGDYWRAPSTIEIHTKQLVAYYSSIMQKERRV